MPLRYVDDRAPVATHWYQHITYPLEWTGNQVFFLFPAIALVAGLYVGRKDARVPVTGGGRAAFDRRYVTAIALGPFAVTTLAATVLGRLPVSMWGYPLWSFAPLAALMWLGPVAEPRRLQRFAKGFLAVFITFPLAYAGIEIFEPFVHDRAKATQFPGATVATAITDMWHDRFGTPLPYVCGSEFDANTVAVYSRDRPHVVPHCDPKLSPWIDIATCTAAAWRWFSRRRSWTPQCSIYGGQPFGAFEVGPPMVLPRQTWHPVQPSQVFYTYIAPRP